MQKLIHFMYDTVLGFLVKLIGSIMVLSVIIQIACRYLPMTPLRWTEELARLTFIWFSFLGSAMTLSRLQHLSIDYFFLKLDERTQKLFNSFAWLVMAFFSTIIAFYGMRLTGIVAMQRSPMLQLPMSYFYAAVPVGGILLAFYALVSFAYSIFGSNKAVVVAE